MVKATRDEKSDYKKLSIQVRLNGLSFCLLETVANEILWYKSVNFSKDYNPVKLLGEIQLFYQKEAALKHPVNEVVVLFSNQLYSLVPEEYFVPAEASSYLKFGTKILKTDIVAFDHLKRQEMINVYIPFTNITNYFFDKYGEFEYKHNISVFIEAVLSRDSGEGITFYVNTSQNYYDLVVIKDNQLLLANTFNYDTPEDFIYYLLFTAEQLKAAPLQLELLLLGNISEASDLYSIAYKYIKNVRLFKPELEFTGESKPSEEFQREYFLSLKSLGCE